MSQTSQPLRLGAGMSAQAAALQARLSTLGVVAKAVGAVLRLSPASKVPPDLLAEVRSHKAALIALLAAPVVAAAVAPRPSLGLIPADHAATPFPALAALGADEGDAGILRRYGSALEGLLRASRCRPVSWADAAARPSPGSWCRNCEYSRWWGDERGWRCWTCHPPDGRAAGTFEEVQT